MLLDFLSQYLRDVEAAVRKLKGAYVERFPHHKHLSDKVAGAEEPSILKVIDEAKLLA